MKGQSSRVRFHIPVMFPYQPTPLAGWTRSWPRIQYAHENRKNTRFQRIQRPQAKASRAFFHGKDTQKFASLTIPATLAGKLHGHGGKAASALCTCTHMHAYTRIQHACEQKRTQAKAFSGSAHVLMLFFDYLGVFYNGGQWQYHTLLTCFLL